MSIFRRKNKKICTFCGKANRNDVGFCARCGCSTFRIQAQSGPAHSKSKPQPNHDQPVSRFRLGSQYSAHQQAQGQPTPHGYPQPQQPQIQPQPSSPQYGRPPYPQVPARPSRQYPSYSPERYDSVPKAVFMSDLQEGSYIPGYEEEFGGDTTFLDDGESGYGGDTETTMLDMSGARKAYLVREGTGERIQITNSKFAIGRKKGGVDYYVTGHTSVSRTHAVILSQEGHHFVIDLNSSNKTYVGGVEIAPNVEREIVSGTRIRFADVDFIFKID